jgi:hypothetical protein
MESIVTSSGHGLRVRRAYKRFCALAVVLVNGDRTGPGGETVPGCHTEHRARRLGVVFGSGVSAPGRTLLTASLPEPLPTGVAGAERWSGYRICM